MDDQVCKYVVVANSSSSWGYTPHFCVNLVNSGDIYCPTHKAIMDSVDTLYARLTAKCPNENH